METKVYSILFAKYKWYQSYYFGSLPTICTMEIAAQDENEAAEKFKFAFRHTKVNIISISLLEE